MYMKGREKIWAEETREGSVEITAWSVGVWVWGQKIWIFYIERKIQRLVKMRKGKGKPPNSNLLIISSSTLVLCKVV